MFRFPWLTSLILLGGCATQSALPVATAAPSPQKKMNANFDYSRASTLAQSAALLVQAQNEFGARLLAHLEQLNAKHENLLASPTSLWQALSLVQTGARGQTKSELQGLLSLKQLPDAKLGEGNRAFNELLGEQKGASILVANSAWFADAFHPDPTFVQSAQNNFGAGIERFALAQPDQTAQKINDWVSSHTQKEIPQIVSKSDVEGQSAVLVNAVYFRGGWENTFDKTLTKPAPFHRADKTTVSVPMMSQTIRYSYLKGHSFDGARLPYENTSCALWVLLPQSGKTPLDVLRELGQSSSRQLSASGSVDLRLPRFEVNWENELSNDLKALGAKTPFGANADFSAMGQPTANISTVIHVTKMRVDEEGTVAAAATAVGMAGSAAPRPEPPKKLVFDRPFVVALVEETSGARLFEGVVFDPTK